jgi:glycosyltransferase involved in cell wall biosynthesis
MSRARARVCFVLPSLNGGGAERAAVHILNALDNRRWQRSMYLFRREGPYLTELHPDVTLTAGAGRSRVARWLELRRFVRETRPNLVVSFLSYLSVLSATRSAAVGARVVFNQQTPMSAFLTDADYRWRRPWHRRAFSAATRIGYRFADAVVTTSAGVADDLVATFGIERASIRVVHNPVDLGAIAAAIDEPLDSGYEQAWSHPAIVAAGRLADAKNYPLLLAALAIVRKRVPARLFILGEGEREGELRDLTNRLGLSDAVVFCGFQRNPWKYIARADVFAMSSRYEGFGNVLVEAMACGVPVVATSSPGTREIVTVGKDGLLVDRHDPEALAAALERVLSDQDLRKRMAQAALQNVARFALPQVAAAYERVFAALVGASSTSV